jgi:hypothetical protein
MIADNIRFSSFSDALDCFNKIINGARQHLNELEQEQGKKQRVIEKTRQQAAGLQQHISLEEWHKLGEETKAALLPPDPTLVSANQFDKEDRTAVEWAMWSWNPITGCEYICPNCYSREIATSTKMAKVIPMPSRRRCAPIHCLRPGR